MHAAEFLKLFLSSTSRAARTPVEQIQACAAAFVAMDWLHVENTGADDRMTMGGLYTLMFKNKKLVGPLHKTYNFDLVALLTDVHVALVNVGVTPANCRAALFGLYSSTSRDIHKGVAAGKTTFERALRALQHDSPGSKKEDGKRFFGGSVTLQHALKNVSQRPPRARKVRGSPSNTTPRKRAKK